MLETPTLEQNTSFKFNSLREKAKTILNHGKRYKTSHKFQPEDPLDTAEGVDSILREKLKEQTKRSTPNFSAESYTPRASVLDLETNSHLFDVKKSVLLLDQLVKIHGFEKAKQIAIDTYAQDLRSFTWEITKTYKPYETGYTLTREVINGQEVTKLVHDSDVHLNNKDILDGVTNYRRGGERFQATTFKNDIRTLSEDQTLFWVSPQRAESETEQDCFYEDTMINIAERKGDEVKVRQYITKLISAESAAEFINNLSGEQILSPDSNIDQVLRTITKLDKKLTDNNVWQAVEKVVGREIGFAQELPRFNEIESLIMNECHKGAERFLEAILAATSTTRIDQIESLYFDVIKDILNQKYQTTDDLVGDSRRSSFVDFSYVFNGSYGGGGGGGFVTSCGKIGGGRGALGMMTSSEDGSGGSEGKKGIKCDGCGLVNLADCLKNDRTCHKCGSSLG